MFKFSQSLVNIVRNNRNLNLILQCSKTTIVKPDLVDEEVAKLKPLNPMVAAAFASLKPSENGLKTPVTDSKIQNAESVSELLGISDGIGVSRRHALKVVSTLSEWSASGRVQLSEFENDPRFIKLCRVLTRPNGKHTRTVSKSEDLSMVLSVTADDEAARLVANLSLPQAVKVLSALALKQRRSTSLLRALSYNISGSSDVLNIKESADILYSISVLNFPDVNLIEKVCSDVINELKDGVKRSSVIGSILTSLGHLRFKNPEILDVLSDWIHKNAAASRPSDIFSLFITLGAVNYTPMNSEQIFKDLVPQLQESDARKPSDWLNLVWALLVLKQATSQHFAGVLSVDFLNRLEGVQALNPFSKLKLLNIDASARLLEDYSGPLLTELSNVRNLNIERTREKIEMVEAVVNTLKNFVQSEKYVGVNIDTKLGVFIDVKCVLDQKCKIVPLQDERSENMTKVAILVHDYHCLARGKSGILGGSIIAGRLLQAQGYKILNVPYSEFKSTDKLVYRVQYLESKLKEIVT